MSGPKTPASPSPKKPTQKQPKVFDIRRPGKAIASPTSRPVITPPKVKDSLLVTKPQSPTPQKPSRIASDPYEEHDLMDSTKKVMIQPAARKPEAAAPSVLLQQSGPTPQPSAAPETPKTSPLAEEPSQSAASAPISHPSAPAISNDIPTPAAHAEGSALSQPAGSQTHEEVIASTAPPEVDMSRAVISTHVSPRRHVWREVLVIVGLLLFVVAAFDILLDAKILHISGVPHTNLFTKGN